ncbi:twin-arginine translocase TatA/TatE family subunit [Oceanibaculum pacificum]|uniref:Sec-independent protein translocase protein TatA n=1 Tax=Oceanibaculum pacificum TaxID=580166 RepID=A0A154VBT9_9PROT|nr:twin-arginine translocase TatA/TatE family subunit [Oceanibaculum pacificum]KZC98840.1 preprotein translocase subunit TatA [Oceanibaculum pacificum]
MSIGFWQVILILVIVLIIFGAGKLPKVMGDVAKGVKSFKSGMKDEDDAPADANKTINQSNATNAAPTAAPKAAAAADPAPAAAPHKDEVAKG